MKRLGLTIAILIVLSGMTSPSADARGGFGITLGVFYSSLGSHGEWISVDAGVYAWRPMRVAAGWRPYWDGRWIWTDDGWYWDSDEPWAWATYHYGRWYYDDYYGWIWTPGYEWAPAWVEWRYGGDYIGWAPLGPYAVFNAHFGIHYNRHWVTPYHYWSFVDCRYMTHHDVNRYVYRTDNNTRFIGRTRTAGSVRWDNGRVVTRGPEAGYIERRGDVRIPRTELVDVRSNDELRSIRNTDRVGVYRPRVEENRADERNERPDNIRERERMPSLDSREMDLGSRDRSRERGREVERLAPKAATPGDTKATERNRGWFEAPPGSTRNGERQGQPEIQNRRDGTRSRVEGRNERPQERSVERPASRPQERSWDNSTSRPQQRGSSVGPERQSSGRSSEGRSAGRSGGQQTQRPSSRGRER